MSRCASSRARWSSSAGRAGRARARCSAASTGSEPIIPAQIIVDGVDVDRGQAQDHRAARRDRHGVPALQPVPASDGAGERHAGARCRCARMPRADAEAAARDCWRRSALPRRRTPTRRSCRAASSSAWRSRVRWPCSRRSCCSTSRPPRSIPEMIQRGARRDATGARGHDHGRRHPRDGLRAQRRRPGDVHGRRPHRRAGRAEDILHASRTSEPRFLGKILSHV